MNRRKKKQRILGECVEIFQSQQITTTKQSYHYVLRDMVNFLGIAKTLDVIDERDLAKYCDEIGKREYATATVVKYYKTIKTFFNWCVKMGYIKVSPSSFIKLPRLNASVDRNKAMGETELALLLEYARYNPRHYALLLFFADTGCRAGGAAGLRMRDIDFENRQAIVTEKGAKTRVVGFQSVCAKALQTWLDKCERTYDEYVFSLHGEKLEADTVSQIIRRMCLKVGVRSLGSHSLRHRKGHQLANSRLPVSVAADVMGHHDPSVTYNSYYPKGSLLTKKAFDELGVREKDDTNFKLEGFVG